MNAKLLLPALALATISLASCNANGKQESKAVISDEPAIDMTALDTMARPQDDFYRFTNGGWMDANPLKPAYSRYGSFDILREQSLERIHDIVEELSGKEPKTGTNEYRVAVLYKQAMDSVTRNKLGAEPIKEELARIEKVADMSQLVEFMAESANRGEGSIFFGSYVHADQKNSTMNIMHLVQPGLALGNRDYYLKKEEEGVLKGYNEYVKRILALAGYAAEDVERIATNNLAVAKQLAEMSYSQVELRNSDENYHMLNVAEFVTTNKGFDWTKYLGMRKLEGLEKWDVAQIKYFEKFNAWFPTADLRALKDYIIVSHVDGAANYLSDDFAEASFDFYGRQLSGRKEQHPRWRRSVNLVNGVLGEALGEVYVKHYFPAEAKERMLVLVKNLQVALGERIAGLEWMSDATKAMAQEKLNNFKVKIGYPDKWKDYSALKISDSKSYYENLQAVTLFEHNRNMEELGKPVDMERWLMNPQDVNAYYMPTTNEICFPAGILQPPFFNMNADDAVNYGAIGVVIGHEMTHGFDDQGSKFDKEGNMNNWWTDEDAAKFKTATQKLVEQFDALEVEPGTMANGQLTLGENIADQGGLLIAYLALQKANVDQAPIEGFTPAQRFFIGYSRVWGQNITKEEKLRLTKLDPHSLGQYRVNQTLRNIDAFYEAFNIQPEDKMYLAPEKRVVVW